MKSDYITARWASCNIWVTNGSGEKWVNCHSAQETNAANAPTQIVFWLLFAQYWFKSFVTPNTISSSCALPISHCWMLQLQRVSATLNDGGDDFSANYKPWFHVQMMHGAYMAHVIHLFFSLNMPDYASMYWTINIIMSHNYPAMHPLSYPRRFTKHTLDRSLNHCMIHTPFTYTPRINSAPFRS